MTAASVLVVDDDADIARFIEVNLQLEGFEVRVAHAVPDLALLDVMMPRLDGVEVCRRMRGNPTTAAVPVIMLTAKSLSADKVAGLTAGADDYIIKPFDTLELVARVRSTLRRTAEMRAVSPLTGLPGNHRIAEEIARRLAGTSPVAVCHADLDNFKAFNDRYGWVRGDEVITLLAATLKGALGEAGEPQAFLGHVGGDDFVVVCTPEQVEDITSRCVTGFDAAVAALHDPDDAARGEIVVVDRRGRERRYPLVSVSIGVADSSRRPFTDPREVSAVATEMKTVAKATPGSSVAVDRRGELATRAEAGASA